MALHGGLHPINFVNITHVKFDFERSYAFLYLYKQSFSDERPTPEGLSTLLVINQIQLISVLSAKISFFSSKFYFSSFENSVDPDQLWDQDAWKWWKGSVNLITFIT